MVSLQISAISTKAFALNQPRKFQWPELAETLLFLTLLLVLTLVGAGSATAQAQSEATKTTEQITPLLREPPTPASCVKPGWPINMLVLGDSIMWGQGLREQNKISYQVQDWLCRRINVPVKVWREAHSGAVLKVDPPGSDAEDEDDRRDDNRDEKSKSEPVAPEEGLAGEINVSEPVLDYQLKHAVSRYQRANVDLVLMDGCINDFNFRNFINPTMSLEAIDRRAKKKCLDRMTPFLKDVSAQFPTARIIVTGYYPVFTEKSARNLLLRFITGFVIPKKKQRWLFPNDELFRKLLATSRQWAKSSNDYLQKSVEESNGPAQGRIVFVPVYDQPTELAGNPPTQMKCGGAQNGFGFPCSGFAAPKTHSLLWTSLMNATGRRRLSKFFYVLFGLNFHMLRPNDQVYFDRKRVCEKSGFNFGDRIQCRVAAYGHPNQMGADEYVKRVIRELQRLFDTTDWLRTNR